MVLKHSLKSNSYKAFSPPEDYNNLINDVHHYYYSHSDKRLNYLKEMEQEMNFKLYKLKPLQKFCWVSSFFDAIYTLKNQWLILVKNLESIKNSAEFNQDSKKEASRLIDKLKNKNFLLICHFLENLFEHL